MRPCGDCRLCCKLFPVPVLEKPAGEWCRHSCAGGCAIHGLGPPEVCRQYDCYWRDHDELPDGCRPDRIGVVITEAGNVGVGGHNIPVVTFQEDFAGAAKEPEGSQLLARFVRRGFAILVIHALGARTEFDRDRYPGVSAEQIEAALLYEISQDADELRRLGAVDDSYQKMTLDEARAACRK
jgi:hypothetical protein